MAQSDLLAWADFETAAPELARLARDRFERFGFVLIGTLRADGAPRINPVEAYVVDGRLTMNMMAQSLKALDLLRDPRILVHTPITRKEGDEGEVKLRGRAVPIEDAALRRATSDAIAAVWDGWRPAEDSHYFEVRLGSAAFESYADDDRRTRLRWP
jgi:Pyridoxamine 5'-phosphate oxidase